MVRYCVAIDLGSSGFRAQALDASSGAIISTAVTTRHPLPGGNVMDHLHFVLEVGSETAQRIIIAAVNRVLRALGIPPGQVVRLAVCGNPAQLSMFQGMEIRDLAYAGDRKLAALGVVPPLREARIIFAGDVAGLQLPARCELVIPPAVRHEVGADAVAMIIKSGMLQREETALATDFGTNAEMALLHRGRIFTGSTAAGPALEGQQISCGMLALPGVVADLQPERTGHRLVLLDDEMFPVQGPVVDLRFPRTAEEGLYPDPIGVTGTGVLAAIAEALDAGVVKLPRIDTPDGRIHLGSDLYLTEHDVTEAGKAIGALRAGHLALCAEAGIAVEEIEAVYMSGASGTYMDPLKAQRLGMVPPWVKTVCQIGNTSLAMARDLALEPAALREMAELAETLRRSHCVFAASPTFRKIYILELSYWTEGMPLTRYRQLLRGYGMPDLPAPVPPEVVRKVSRDIGELGERGLVTITDIGRIRKRILPGCSSCLCCADRCPGAAISVAADTVPVTLALDESLCYGVSCRRCEKVCPERVFRLDPFFRDPESRDEG